MVRPVGPSGPGSQESVAQRDRLATLAQALLHTEVGFRRDTFGRYSFSAPFALALPSVGLTGMFELDSLIAYRLVSDTLAEARKADDSAQVLFIRDWYVVAVSYCQYKKLDCAQALLAAAREDFANDGVILLLSGSIAETAGRPASAVALLGRALLADPALAEARLRLGRSLVADGQIANGRREIERALDDARASAEAFSEHFALRTLADLDARASRPASAASLEAAAAAIPPFDEITEAAVHGVDEWDVYKAAQYWRVARVLTELRSVIRLPRAASPALLQGLNSARSVSPRRR
jgi:tetratricopeptide (TPR) repeat protein